MRTDYRLQLLTVLALAGCSHASSATSAPTPTPAPLASCETRALTIDDASVVVVASVDGKPVHIDVQSSDPVQQKRAYDQAVAIFGEPHLDTRTTQRPYKWGLIQVTDLCGRLVSPPPSAIPH